jgi:hypothetical protein
VLLAFFRRKGPPLPLVAAAARRLLKSREPLPAREAFRMHPATIETWGDAAFHTLWHLENIGNGLGLEGQDHPPEAFRRYAGRDAFAVIAADAEAGTITIAFADDRYLDRLPSTQAALVAEALARGDVPRGEVERGPKA